MAGDGISDAYALKPFVGATASLAARDTAGAKPKLHVLTCRHGRKQVATLRHEPYAALSGREMAPLARIVKDDTVEHYQPSVGPQNTC
jgi:hypothetical protein